jgi:hypothetical protein
MNPIVTVDAVLTQAEQLSLEEQLLLLEKLASAVRTKSQDDSVPSLKPRTLGLREGQMWMAEDFDAPLPDSF